ncbi:hypothetical protein RHMOL_Rhmol04G0355800 [Rhododendron molle]|uniref:Uncharacterized protein n=2 Tax=Rhododendron molle TaxID=49168 RepID=A0ACC0P8Z5_RHOML|nr:hypothetical protein RHMOL_Rhmol04G0355800 [Rhododendron molle]KAI8561634.1 hypothetical protein RHMOL_Rhmol04G0355800 [Rhododendron molle]
MANSDSTPSIPPVAPLSSKKENIVPMNSKLVELSESRLELLSRIQGLKQDLQSWRSKLDTQVKTYRDELSELKKSLNVEVEQLRSLQDVSGEVKEAEGAKVESNDEKVDEDLPKEDNPKDTEQ